MYLHAAAVCIYTSARVRSGFPAGGHGERASLLPGVYLQSVTLMQRNDYFYSRYFASLVPLSGTAPHWPTDYLGGDRHTWLLQPSSPSALSFRSFASYTLARESERAEVGGHRGRSDFPAQVVRLCVGVHTCSHARRRFSAAISLFYFFLFQANCQND